MLVERELDGLAYLASAGALLRAARRRAPTGGIWEAADLQWWWRKDQHPDPAGAVFWFDGDRPVAACVVTDWGDGRFGCDVLDDGSRPRAELLAMVRPRLADRLPTLDGPVEMVVRDDDAELLALAAEEGFTPTAEVGVTTWMAAADRPAVPTLPDGRRLAGRDELADRPHHMIARSGPHVAARLAECPLYRPDLDLAVLDPAGEVAAYGLFWADPATAVGLVEPMRTEDAFQGRGLARCLLAEGLARLAGAGCERLKVTYIEGNDAARRLYLGAGFAPVSTDRTYRR